MVGRALGDEGAVFQHHKVFTDLHDQAHVVLDEQHGDAGLSGFVAEMTIFNGAFMDNDTFHRVVTIIACTSIVITAVYILRVVGKILYGTCTNEAHLRLSDATWDERLSVVCLVVAIAGMGLAPLWVSDMIRGSVSEIITHLMN